MSRRVTRSTKISDHFSVCRKPSELPGKSLKDDGPSTTSSANRTLFPSEVEFETVQEKKHEVKPGPARALFFAPKKVDKKKEIKEEPAIEVKEKVLEPVRSIIPTDAEIVDSKSTVVRKPSVADVQAELAKQGAAKVHEQATARKLELIAEREAFLKSPQKIIQTKISGGSPPKRAKKETKKREGPIKVLRIPDQVLPSKSAEKKERAERERSKEREESPQDDLMSRAPKGYGRSLMSEEVKKAANVPLPSSYQDLFNLFKSCEQIYSIMDAAGKTVTFSMLAETVTKDTRKKFSLDHMAQLLEVYPQAYKVHVQQARSARWEHVVKANLDEDLSSFVTGPLLSEQSLPSEPILTTAPSLNRFSPMKGRPIISSSGVRVPSSPRKPASPVKNFQREVIMDGRRRLEGWRIACRVQVFRYLLTRRVNDAHDEFMKKLQLPVETVVPASPFVTPRDFHQNFRLEINSLCPPIGKAEMEQIPEEENVAGGSHQGMSDFIKILSETVSVLPKAVDDAILDLKSPVKKTVSSRGVPLSPAKFKEAPKPMSVLERIRARKAAEAAAEMRRNPELEEKLCDLERLLDKRNLALIFEIYRSNSRTSMDITILAERMGESKRITKDMAPSLLTRLTRLAPSYFSISTISLGKFFRISPDNSTKTQDTVESLLKEERTACRTQTAAGSLRSP